MDIDLKIARPLTATMHKMHRADTDNYITGIAPQGKTNVRRLTPIECERLQGVNDNYTDCVSDTQRYRMLGNGWTVDVIAHIFSFLKEGEILIIFLTKMLIRSTIVALAGNVGYMTSSGLNSTNLSN
jgi:hypothetical protein